MLREPGPTRRVVPRFGLRSMPAEVQGPHAASPLPAVRLPRSPYTPVPGPPKDHAPVRRTWPAPNAAHVRMQWSCSLGLPASPPAHARVLPQPLPPRMSATDPPPTPPPVAAGFPQRLWASEPVATLPPAARPWQWPRRPAPGPLTDHAPTHRVGPAPSAAEFPIPLPCAIGLPATLPEHSRLRPQPPPTDVPATPLPAVPAQAPMTGSVSISVWLLRQAERPSPSPGTPAIERQPDHAPTRQRPSALKARSPRTGSTCVPEASARSRLRWPAPAKVPLRPAPSVVLPAVPAQAPTNGSVSISVWFLRQAARPWPWPETPAPGLPTDHAPPHRSWPARNATESRRPLPCADGLQASLPGRWPWLAQAPPTHAPAATPLAAPPTRQAACGPRPGAPRATELPAPGC